MKNSLLVLVLIALCTFNAHAQQKKQAQTMLISIYEEGYGFGKTREKIIVTKEDGTQEERETRISSSSYSTKMIQAKEDSLLQTLKPYLDAGWKLVASTSTPIPLSNGDNMLTRFFLRKGEE